MKTINSLNNPMIQYLKTLQITKNRYHYQEFLIEGWYLIEVALKKQAVVAILLLEAEKEHYHHLIPSNVEVFLVTKAIIKKISQTISPQPIIALCKFQNYRRENNNNIILLDGIQDPSNLGSILRSCAAFNIEKIFLSENSVDIYNHKVISASKGAIFNVAFEYCQLADLIRKLKQENYYFYGTFLHEAKMPIKLNQIKFQQKNAFLFGNESKGISKVLRPLIDENFIITTTNKVESINLAISVAVTIYTLFITINK